MNKQKKDPLLKQFFLRLILLIIFPAVLQVNCQAGENPTSSPETILYSKTASPLESMAAKEVRRYLYLRTGKLLITDKSLDTKKPLLLIGPEKNSVTGGVLNDSSLKKSIDQLLPEQYMLKTIKRGNVRILLVAGGNPVSLLYGAYSLAERFGIRFYMHGDVIPDKRIDLVLPDLDESAKPLFNLRGIQPFHDFPEGPDWWNSDDYKAIFEQLVKLRMNFFGLHTYPEGGVGPEPLTWIGLKEDVEKNGNVKKSYPSRHDTTYTEGWGYRPGKTSDFVFGASEIFERDDFGADYMKGVNPWKKAPEKIQNELFNRMGRLLGDLFSYARSLGIKTCLGTETPLIVPKALKANLKKKGKDPADPAIVEELYEGIFQRIMKTFPLDYYWLWTPEGWTWSGTKKKQVDATIKDLKDAITAAEKVKAPFTLATCGWVLGPPGNRALFDEILPKKMPMSCINRNVGFAFVEKGFEQVKGRPKWAIPWLEDDPGLTMPQLWAGRMRRDAADALAYGCTGLMGIHWRTRILGPNVSALAKAAWNQKPWNPDFRKPAKKVVKKILPGREGGTQAHFPNNAIAGTELDTIYQQVLYDVDAYRVKVPNGTYTVTLNFCEPHYAEKGKRVFGVKIQGKKVIKTLDIFEKVGQNKALDYTFDKIKVEKELLNIEFVRIVEYPCIAGISIKGRVGGRDFVKKINCGGGKFKDYDADLPDVKSVSGRPRDLPVADFYRDWALSQFGPGAAASLAKLFTNLDGFPGGMYSGRKETKLPRPSNWIGGPGGVRPDARDWKTVSKDYGFVDRMAALRSRVTGAGNLERFDYWLNIFCYLRAEAKGNCIWARFNSAMKKVKAEKNPAVKRKLAKKIALSVRKELVAQTEKVNRFLLQAVTTNGGLGNVDNWQQHIIPSLLTDPGKELARILGTELPPDAVPSKKYSGKPRIFAPTVRTSLKSGEALNLKVIMLGANPVDAAIYWKPLGGKRLSRKELVHVCRGVYKVTLRPKEIREDFEYFVKVVTDKNRKLVFPASAPELNQTVLVIR